MQEISRYFTKNTSFNILSLADQLHCSKLTIPNSLESRKIYFSKNLTSNLLEKCEAILHKEVNCYNLSLSRNELLSIMSNKYTLKKKIQILKLLENNEQVNELFSQNKEANAIILDLSKFYL